MTHVEFEKMRPRYVNSFNVSILSPSMYIWPLQFANVACVLRIFMLKSLSKHRSLYTGRNSLLAIMIMGISYLYKKPNLLINIYKRSFQKPPCPSALYSEDH